MSLCSGAHTEAYAPWILCSTTREAAAMRRPLTAARKSSPHLPQPEKACAKQGRPSTTKKKNWTVGHPVGFREPVIVGKKPNVFGIRSGKENTQRFSWRLLSMILMEHPFTGGYVSCYCWAFLFRIKHHILLDKMARLRSLLKAPLTSLFLKV